MLTSDNALGAARAAAAPGGARRRADRLRAGAGLRAVRLEGHAGRDAAAPAGARGPRRLGDGRARASSDEGVDVLTGHKRGAASRRRRAACSSASTQGSEMRIEFDAPAVRGRPRRRTPRATGSRSSASRSPPRAPSRPTNTCRRSIPNIYACGDVAGPVPVHPHRLAPGLVRGGQRAVRRLAQVPRRLLGDPVGDLHRSRRSRASGLNETEAKAQSIAVRGHALRHRRARPRDRRRATRTAWSRC